MPAASPYITALAFGRAKPTHITEDAVEDLNRVTAYETYEDIFHNVPDIFKVTVKVDAGNEILQRFVPSARSIVEACNRYLCKDLQWKAKPADAATAVDPSGAGTSGGDEAVGEALSLLEALFVREEFGPKFLSMKRWMLIRGDGMFHLTADPLKPEGTRLRITELNPGSYFAIEDPADSERVIGCYIVNLIADDEDEEIAARLEYRKVVDEDVSALANGAPLGSIFMRLGFYELDGWDDRGGEDTEAVAPPSRFGADRFASLLEGTALPAEITALPVYHIRNNRRGNSIFGTSEIQGIETLISGINQTATDQDLAVALQGLGVYWTDSGKSRDEDGNVVPWKISPASMIEVQDGKKIGRVEGISSVEPSVGHIDMLKREARETTGTPDIAIGSVDVASAESGVALSIKMAPILEKNAEKQEDIGNKLDQFAFDLLNGWLPAYEGYSPQGVTVTAEFGPALPINRKEVVEEIVALVGAKIISADFGRVLLENQLGYTFPTGMLEAITAEAQALEDVMGARLDAAVADDGGAPAEPAVV